MYKPERHEASWVIMSPVNPVVRIGRFCGNNWCTWQWNFIMYGLATTPLVGYFQIALSGSTLSVSVPLIWLVVFTSWCRKICASFLLNIAVVTFRLFSYGLYHSDHYLEWCFHVWNGSQPVDSTYHVSIVLSVNCCCYSYIY